MPYVSKEQIARAKQLDLLAYLQQHEPQELVRAGPHEYRTRSHDSLVISNGKWHWCSRGIGGRTALDYLIHVQGMEFTEAVRQLCEESPAPLSFSGGGTRPRTSPSRPKSRRSASVGLETLAAARSAGRRSPGEPASKPFQLPFSSQSNSRVIDYLAGRGIDLEIIRLCIENGGLYESAPYHSCVFVGKAAAGIPRFASVRGTSSGFKQDVPGSDKRFNFCLSAQSPGANTVRVYESAIDALSHATLRKLQSMVWRDCHYLALSGCSSLALTHFLEQRPEIETVCFCLDADEAGRKATERIVRELLARPDYCGLAMEEEPPPHGKDYNEYLQWTLAGREMQPAKKIKNERSFAR
ncbi:DUF3991 and toprim domain-containing protein [Anaerotruncus rubiinfantis]|uniref:DUF3991 and toprim domain-containing protein n=1 Tax=Anaerotruncus rubiinfantis TaxID=1720200 RepID=UPI0011C87D9E|nr:DUF3991 and toprim domain-containing protein [Anaerotruncus rubiinfantis]